MRSTAFMVKRLGAMRSSRLTNLNKTSNTVKLTTHGKVVVKGMPNLVKCNGKKFEIIRIK